MFYIPSEYIYIYIYIFKFEENNKHELYTNSYYKC